MLPTLENAIMIKNDEPLFVLSIKFYELYCLIDQQNDTHIIEGDEYKKILNEFLLYVCLHPEPNIEQNGHEYVFIKIQEKNKIKLLL